MGVKNRKTVEKSSQKEKEKLGKKAESFETKKIEQIEADLSKKVGKNEQKCKEIMKLVYEI